MAPRRGIEPLTSFQLFTYRLRRSVLVYGAYFESKLSLPSPRYVGKWQLSKFALKMTAYGNQSVVFPTVVMVTGLRRASPIPSHYCCPSTAQVNGLLPELTASSLVKLARIGMATHRSRLDAQACPDALVELPPS